jgi:ABC-type lipopolysaccharide export system ATPase subunit
MSRLFLVVRRQGKIDEINRDNVITILIVEQKVLEVLEICNRVYSVKLGNIALEGLPGEFKDNKERFKGICLYNRNARQPTKENEFIKRLVQISVD